MRKAKEDTRMERKEIMKREGGHEEEERGEGDEGGGGGGRGGGIILTPQSRSAKLSIFILPSPSGRAWERKLGSIRLTDGPRGRRRGGKERMRRRGSAI